MRPAIETVYRTDNRTGSAYVTAHLLGDWPARQRRVHHVWEYELGEEGNHREAARKLAEANGMHGRWLGGHTERGYAFVCLVGGPVIASEAGGFFVEEV